MSNNIVQNQIWLIGTGSMAEAYIDVLKDLDISISVIGRGKASAKSFEEKTGIKPISGGIENYLKNHHPDESTNIIIAVGTEALMPTLKVFCNQSFRRILIEKPAAISIEELLENEYRLQSISNKVFVAYNRRFYSSVKVAQKLINEDGGLLSMHFEFTEWAHKIEPLEKEQGVKENWFFANSTHVIDLAFYLAGTPTDWQAFSKSGELNWHDKTNFSGAGLTEKGVVFSYLSNWESAGRWGIELLTNKRRLYLKPLEGIQIQERGSIAIHEYEIDDEIDRKYKPGLYKQVCAFVEDKRSELVELEEHINNSRGTYTKILGLA